MKCENCKIDHDGSYGSGRFCSLKCARGYSTKNKREEINIKVSKSLMGRESWIPREKRNHNPFTKEQCFRGGITTGKIQKENAIQLWKETGKYTRSLKQLILEEQKHKCAICNNEDIWCNKPLIFILDHIDGNS